MAKSTPLPGIVHAQVMRKIFTYCQTLNFMKYDLCEC